MQRFTYAQQDGEALPLFGTFLHILLALVAAVLLPLLTARGDIGPSATTTQAERQLLR